MKEVTAHAKTTLLLNGAWQPITTVTARSAFVHLMKGRVTALDKNTTFFHSLQSWISYGDFYEDQPAIKSAKSMWPVPTIIVVTSKFFSKPKKKKLSLFELAKVYDNVCQYCMERHSIKSLTIDHIQPKSKGGSDEYDNRALACRACNSEKGNSLLYRAINGKLPVPMTMPALIVNAPVIRDEWKPFLPKSKKVVDKKE